MILLLQCRRNGGKERTLQEEDSRQEWVGVVHSSLNMAEQVPIVLDVVHDDRSLKMLLMKPVDFVFVCLKTGEMEQ